MIHEHDLREPNPPLLFYLAADSAEAYRGLQQRFPSRIRSTERECADSRCDFRE